MIHVSTFICQSFGLVALVLGGSMNVFFWGGRSGWCGKAPFGAVTLVTLVGFGGQEEFS